MAPLIWYLISGVVFGLAIGMVHFFRGWVSFTIALAIVGPLPYLLAKIFGKQPFWVHLAMGLSAVVSLELMLWLGKKLRKKYNELQRQWETERSN